MANSIARFKKYIPLLDEFYRKESLTAVLDGANELLRQGYNANELLIPNMDMDGLSDYNGKYVDGDVSFTYETVKCNFDKGKKFTIDVMDDIETENIAFGKLASTFVKDKVVPHIDAFRFATYASTAGVGKAEDATYTTGEQVIEAIAAGMTEMDENEIPDENRYLFITPTLYGLIVNLNTNKSREILDSVNIVKVPQKRFYTAIETDTNGGYKKAAGAADINFIIAHKEAVIQFDKHVSMDTITPDKNADSDGYIVKYRNVGIADVYENKAKGIYVSTKAVG